MLKDFNFKKKFGQNFITDTNLLKAIVNDSGIDDSCEVLEVGAGAGTLTKQIALKAKNVVSFEIDNDLKEILDESLKEQSNIRLIYKDILKTKAEEINSYFNTEFHVISNLPYYITTPLLFFFLENNLNIKTMTLMMQREVAQRLCAKCGTKDYGAITLTVNLKSEVKILRIINRKNFYPVPNVDSAIIRFEIKKDKYKIQDETTLVKLIKCGFAMRRKTLANNIALVFESVSKEKACEAIKQAGFNENIRGESLSVEEYILLHEKILKIL